MSNSMIKTSLMLRFTSFPYPWLIESSKFHVAGKLLAKGKGDGKINKITYVCTFVFFTIKLQAPICSGHFHFQAQIQLDVIQIKNSTAVHFAGEKSRPAPDEWVILFVFFFVFFFFLLQWGVDETFWIAKNRILNIMAVDRIYDCLFNLYSGADQRKHQSSALLAFVRGILRGPMNSPHKWPVTRKMFPFDDVIM